MGVSAHAAPTAMFKPESVKVFRTGSKINTLAPTPGLVVPAYILPS